MTLMVDEVKPVSLSGRFLLMLIPDPAKFAYPVTGEALNSAAAVEDLYAS